MPRAQVVIRCNPGVMIDSVIQSIEVTKGVDAVVVQMDKDDGHDWTHVINTHRGDDKRFVFGEDIMLSRNNAVKVNRADT